MWNSAHLHNCISSSRERPSIEIQQNPPCLAMQAARVSEILMEGSCQQDGAAYLQQYKEQDIIPLLVIWWPCNPFGPNVWFVSALHTLPATQNMQTVMTEANNNWHSSILSHCLPRIRSSVIKEPMQLCLSLAIES